VVCPSLSPFHRLSRLYAQYRPQRVWGDVRIHGEQGTNPLLILVRFVHVEYVLPALVAFVLFRAEFRPLIGLDLLIERAELGSVGYVGMMDRGDGVSGGCRGLDRSGGSGGCSVILGDFVLIVSLNNSS